MPESGIHRAKSNFIGIGLSLFAILMIITAVYYPALSGPLLLDDNGSVLTSKISELTYSEIMRAARHNESGPLGRPISVISFSLNLHFWPDNVFVLKITNLVIHLINTIFIYFLTQKIFSNCISTKDTNRIRIFALIATSLWALHPLQISTVMYVVQRMTLLMTMFTLLALLAYLHAREKPSKKPLSAVGWIFVVHALSLLACLSKENGVLIYLYILVLEGACFRFRHDNSRLISTKNIIPILCCYLPTAVGVILIFTTFDILTAGYATREYNLPQRLLTEPGIMIMYLKLITIPNLTEMHFYHDAFPIETTINAVNIFRIASLAAIIIVAVVTFRRAPLFTIGCGIFFVSHSLESTYIPLELVFEHRNYLSILGIAIILTWLYSFLQKNSKFQFIRIIPAILVLLLMSSLTYSRSVEWSNGTTINSFALDANPMSIRARTALAIDLHNVGQKAESIKLLRNGLSLYPENTALAALLFHLLSINNDLSQSDLNSISHAVTTGKITKAIIYELFNITNSIKFSKIQQNSYLANALFETVINRQDKILQPKTEALLMASFADFLFIHNEYRRAQTFIDNAISLDGLNTRRAALRSNIEQYVKNTQ